MPIISEKHKDISHLATKIVFAAVTGKYHFGKFKIKVDVDLFDCWYN